MNKLILAVALAAGCTLASSGPALAAARTYDCSKPGNANKAACKTGAKDAIKGSTKPTAAKAAAPVKPATKATPAKTASTRNYDCSKAGNVNKAACKGTATAAAKPASTPSPTKPSMLQRMKSALTNSSKPAPKAAAMPTKPAAASVEDKNPAGAIAQCKDGSYSHAKVRTGACSRHGGVAKWS